MLIVADENIPLLDAFFAGFGEIRRYPGRSIDRACVQDADVLLVRSVTNVDQALLDEASEAGKDLGFVRRIHRAVFGRPIGQDAQAFELAPLFLDEGGGELRAGLADAKGVERLADPNTPFLEIGLLVAHDRYDGQAPGAGAALAAR